MVVAKGLLYQFYYTYGCFVARFPFVFLLVPIIFSFTGVFLAGRLVYIGQVPLNNSVKQFVATDARAWTDEGSFHDLRRQQGLIDYNRTLLNYIEGNHSLVQKEPNIDYEPKNGRQLLFSLIRRKDGGSLLNARDLVLIHRSQQFVVNQMALEDPDLAPLWTNEKTIVWLSSLFQQVEPRKDPDDGYQYIEELTSVFVLIDYRLNLTSNPELAGIKRLYVKAFKAYYKKFAEKYPHLDITAYDEGEFTGFENDIGSEAARLMSFILNLIPIAPFILLFFIGISNFNWFQPENSKLNAGFAGLISTALSLFTSYGFTLAAGHQLNSMSILIPFLILSIGVDDAFLLIAAWKQRENNRNNKIVDCGHRLGDTMGNAATSITLTTATDLSCFIVGLWLTNLDGIRSFCVYASVAIITDFLYQITFFAAVLFYDGRRESLRFCREYRGRQYPLESKQAQVKRIFSRYYVRLLTNRASLTAFLIIYSVYVGFSLFGCTRVNSEMPTAIFSMDGSPLKQLAVQLREMKLRKYAINYEMIVRTPPDFMNLTEMTEFDRFMQGVYQLPNMVGRSGRYVILDDFIRDGSTTRIGSNRYNRTFPEANDPRALRDLSYKLYPMQTQIDYIFVNRSNAAEVAESKNPLIRQLIVTTVFQDFDSIIHGKRIVRTVREYADGFPQFNIYTNSFIAIKASFLYAYIPGMQQTIGLGILAIAVISIGMACAEFYFLPRSKFVAVFFRTSLISTHVLISMQLGVLGFLYWWSVNIGPMCVVCVLMSVGISIDLTAHLALKYEHVLSCGTYAERMEETIYAVGWPILQAALSTYSGIIVLYFVPNDLVRTFYKTITTAITVGLFHGLYVMPSIYYLIHTTNVSYPKIWPLEKESKSKL